MKESQLPPIVEESARAVGKFWGTVDFIHSHFSQAMFADPESILFKLNPFAATTNTFKAVTPDKKYGESGIQVVLNNPYDPAAAAFLEQPIEPVTAIGHNPKKGKDYVQNQNILISPRTISKEAIHPWENRQEPKKMIEQINAISQHWQKLGSVTIDEYVDEIKNQK